MYVIKAENVPRERFSLYVLFYVADDPLFSHEIVFLLKRAMINSPVLDEMVSV